MSYQEGETMNKNQTDNFMKFFLIVAIIIMIFGARAILKLIPQACAAEETVVEVVSSSKSDARKKALMRSIERRRLKKECVFGLFGDSGDCGIKVSYEDAY